MSHPERAAAHDDRREPTHRPSVRDAAGVVVGKLAADVTFYLPVILTYESRRRARKPSHR